MRLTLEVAGESYEVDVERTADGLRVACEGLTRDGSRLADDALRLGDATHRVVLRDDGIAVVDGAPVPFLFVAFAPGPGAAASAAGTRMPVRAMMPGRIVRLDAAPGSAVERGAPVLVLEAMKMQNEVLSPVAGTVAEVAVKVGDVVEVGRVLLFVEPSTRKE